MGLKQDVIFKIKLLFAQGYTTGEIAKKLNISEVIVVNVLRRD